MKSYSKRQLDLFCSGVLGMAADKWRCDMRDLYDYNFWDRCEASLTAMEALYTNGEIGIDEYLNGIDKMREEKATLYRKAEANTRELTKNLRGISYAGGRWPWDHPE